MMQLLGKLCLLCLSAFTLFTCADFVASHDDSVPSYTVTYDGNGNTSGSVPVDSLKYATRETAAVKSNSGGLAKTGCTFSGWNTRNDGSGDSRLPGTVFTVRHADVTLYARWISPGDALWARSVASGPSYSYFVDVATDSSGNVYAAGSQVGNTAFTYGRTNVAGAFSEGTNAVIVKYGPTGTVLWARSVAAGAGSSEFLGVTTDSSGNVYVVGIQKGNAAYTYGTASATGAYSGGDNAVIVKYDPSGTALWARSVAAGNDSTNYSGVAADSSGYVYAVGVQQGNSAYTYGTVNATGASSWINSVIVKYDPSGTAIWAKSVAAGSSGSDFVAVATDASGNVYAVGVQFGNAAYTYGTVSVTGAASSAANSVIVKYDSSGTAQWARSIDAGSSNSNFTGVAADASGNAYAAGIQQGNAAYAYGTASVTGASSNGNAVIVKYDSSGTAQWARSVASGSSGSSFSGVAADASGNVYAAGTQQGNSAYAYGTATVTGTSSDGNAVIVKYDPSGTAQWARSVAVGAGHSYFSRVAADSSGSVYSAGSQQGNSAYFYGSARAWGASSEENAVIVKYAQ